MSIASGTPMGTPFFNEIKKQASDFLREKFKQARLALTDVTPAELLAEEVTSENPWAPDARTMGFISKAAFEIDDFWRIMEILHKRFSKFDRKHWREPYNSLVLLEHLLTHGPESVADEFQCDRMVIRELGNFQHIDERGFNWGLAVRKKSEKILKLLEKGPVLKEERDRARKVTRGIQGFGSMNYRWSNRSKDTIEPSSAFFGRCHSHCESNSQNDDAVFDEMHHRAYSDALVREQHEASIDKEMESKEAVLQQSKLQMAAEEVESPKIEFQKEEHPFVGHEPQRIESVVLLSK
ncbi:hypothetical protein HPP92_019107 [Vanilla planifolia]|uniref:ENTH domain-containing protein n=1 Tax=Vanilla planifolia TaxID=51239 RepID=A0A835UMW4_VANPL|nr:hypothetical protein HPP92_019107 [Vanilla planifolia]